MMQIAKIIVILIIFTGCRTSAQTSLSNGSYLLSSSLGNSSVNLTIHGNRFDFRRSNDLPPDYYSSGYFIQSSDTLILFHEDNSNNVLFYSITNQEKSTGPIGGKKVAIKSDQLLMNITVVDTENSIIEGGHIEVLKESATLAVFITDSLGKATVNTGGGIAQKLRISYLGYASTEVKLHDFWGTVSDVNITLHNAQFNNRVFYEKFIIETKGSDLFLHSIDSDIIYNLVKL